MNAFQLSSIQIFFFLLLSLLSAHAITFIAHFFIPEKPKLLWVHWVIHCLAALVLTSHCWLTFSQALSFCFAYFIPLFALLLAMQTDLESMVILSPFSLWLAPLGLFFAAQDLLSVSFIESSLGITFGYGSLWGINKIVQFLREQNGIGEGDMELMALVGAFWGVHATCYILWGAATIGIIGGLYLLRKKDQDKGFLIKIPFAPSIALSTFIFHFLQLTEVISLSP